MANRSYRPGDTTPGLRELLGMGPRAPRRKGQPDPEWDFHKRGDVGGLRENLDQKNNGSIKHAPLGEPRMAVEERLRQQQEMEAKILLGRGGVVGRGKQGLDEMARLKMAEDSRRQHARDDALRMKRLQHEALELERQVGQGGAGEGGNLARKQREGASRDAALKAQDLHAEESARKHLENKAAMAARVEAAKQRQEEGDAAGREAAIAAKRAGALARDAAIQAQREAEERGRQAAWEAKQKAAVERRAVEAKGWGREAGGADPDESRLDYIRREQAYNRAVRQHGGGGVGRW